jgi:peptidoglycan LD-endopeptidase CwlK
LKLQDIQKLVGVHPDLVKVVLEASKAATFEVVEGARSYDLEKHYIATGKSSLKDPYDSRHVPKGNPPYSRAVDLCPLVNGKRFPADWSKYPPVVKAMKDAAAKLKVPIVWGGDWKTFKDGPHFELDRKVYP